ncbi:protein FAR1-RELATED SEQUENCE 6 [Impatiens glandulifera]|uniref:protein FAR1-RELATED SEQUENCE 6 n=1 Tax=Impatiens glandulifera TaxID=253017 RepID=UPI001FB06128|nr:protein FAR1-RELATED SEQUENCE 6 [Impatiens glandulifera]
MEEVSLDDNEQISEIPNEIDGEQEEDLNYQNGLTEETKEFVEPAVGMEFETYDDAYNYYNCYAKEVGFNVRVKNSWFKRNSREKYGAVLCCSSQGFKRIKDVNRLRKETRTGCPAMLRMRLMDTKRWRILEVNIEHNHLLGSKIHNSTKKMSSGTKRKPRLSPDEEDGSTIKLYRALVIDTGGGGNEKNSNSNAVEINHHPPAHHHPNQLNLKKGDAQAVYNYLCRMQLTNPNFFYLMDLNEEGKLRNVFWADSRSRAAGSYFSDAIYFDNSFLSGKYETPLVAFVGVNHHGQTTLLGCGLLGGETKESYSWVMKSWLTSMSECSPRTVITDRCKSIQTAVSDVFPKARHCFGLSHVMRRVPEKLGGLRHYDSIRKQMFKAIYETMKPFDFETAWGFMIHQFGVNDHKWLQSIYDDRTKWVPIYLKDAFFAGMATAKPLESLNPFFEKYVHKQTPLKEFLDKYELVLQRKHKEEVTAEMESRSATQSLRTRCLFESQLSKVYTNEIFRRFQVEVEEMHSCFGTTQLHIEGPVIIFLVKERVLGDGNRREVRDYEVLYNRGAAEVCCICSGFSFNGYLCRHALCVLNFNGVEEVPSKYVLPRWKKDYKRVYKAENCSKNIDGTERVEWFDQLYRSALQVVEEGTISFEQYKAGLEALEDCLTRLHNVEIMNKEINMV